MAKLIKFTQKMYGDYACCKCGKALVGHINGVCEEEDEEGYHWRSFCDECWETLKDDDAEDIYYNYKVAQAYTGGTKQSQR